MGGQGIFFLVAGPTAAGKTTVLRSLIEKVPEMVKDVSVTSRAPRTGEVDGRAYRFWTREKFEAALARGAFLEHAVVHGSDFYGTLKAPVEEQLNRGVDVIKDIDVQGAEQVRRIWPYPKTVLIFLTPPAPGDLVDRFRGRGTDDEAALQRRLKTARQEVGHVGNYDYLVCNRRVEEAVEDLIAIRRAERLKRERLEADFRAVWNADGKQAGGRPHGSDDPG